MCRRWTVFLVTCALALTPCTLELELSGRVALLNASIDKLDNIRAVSAYLQNQNAAYVQIWRHLSASDYRLEWQIRLQVTNYLGRHVVNLDAPFGPLQPTHKLAIYHEADPGPIPFDVISTSPQLLLSKNVHNSDFLPGQTIFNFDTLSLTYTFSNYLRLCDMPNCDPNYVNTTPSSSPISNTKAMIVAATISSPGSSHTGRGVVLLSETFMQGVLIWLVLLTFLILCIIALLVCLVCKKREDDRTATVSEDTDSRTLPPDECFVVVDDPPYSKHYEDPHSAPYDPPLPDMSLARSDTRPRDFSRHPRQPINIGGIFSEQDI